MTYNEFVNLCIDMLSIIKETCPIDTGNLRYNAIKFKFINSRKIEIWVNEDIAPYMVYTNEPWLSSKWKGATNPNESWWQNAVYKCVELIQSRYKANVTFIGA